MGYKTRTNYTTGLKECLNPEKCRCIFCTRRRNMWYCSRCEELVEEDECPFCGDERTDMNEDGEER